MKRAIPRIAIGLAASAILATAIQCIFLPKKLTPLDADQYGRYAIELEADPNGRYGYVPGMHGAVLVRAPASAPPPRSRPHQRELESFMRSELRSIPRKTALEAIFYFLLGAYLFLGAPRLAAATRNRRMDRFAGIAATFLPGALFFVIAASPLLIGDYGYGGFTNLAGPGAFSYSGPHFHLQSWLGNSSNSISYRAFVSPVVLPPGVLVRLANRVLRSVPLIGDAFSGGVESVWPYWVAGTIFYGGIGAVLSAVGRRLRRRDVLRSI